MYLHVACIIQAAEPSSTASTNYSCHLQAAIRVASVLSGVCLQRCVAGQPTTTTEYRVALVLLYNKRGVGEVANCCSPRDPVQGFSVIIDGDKDVVY